MGKYLYLILFILFICAPVQANSQSQNYFLVKMDQPVESQSESKQTEIFNPSVNTEQVIEIFRAAVNRGELQLFEQKIAFSTLKPQQVEYIYKIGEQKPIVKVYSLLNKPLPLPSMPDIRVEGVTVILDAKGHIIEAVVHCHH
ncbi:hypothetical protein [Kaarinaea lacus]